MRGPIRCAICGEDSPVRGWRAGRIHKWGPVGHEFVPRKPRATISRTYDTVTPESAEHGDVSESGFCDAAGWLSPTGTPEMDANISAHPNLYWVPVALGDVRQAVEWARDNGCTRDNGDGSFYSEDPCHDRAFFEQGAETRFQIHFNGFSARALAIISREIIS